MTKSDTWVDFPTTGRAQLSLRIMPPEGPTTTGQAIVLRREGQLDHTWDCVACGSTMLWDRTAESNAGTRTEIGIPTFWGTTMGSIAGLTTLGGVSVSSQHWELADRGDPSIFGYVRGATGVSHVHPTVWSREIGRDSRLQHADWLGNALEALKEVVSADAQVIPSGSAVNAAGRVIVLCSSMGVTEPTVDRDEDGNIELFVKKAASGLLLVVGSGSLQAFGNIQGDKWRARYELAGTTWIEHLATFLDPFVS